MKKYLVFLVLISPCCLYAQIGLKAGLNFANVTNTSSIGNSSRTGFNAAIFLAPHSKGIISSRTELVFSSQGYDYKTNTNTGNVNLDYIMLPQYLCINITKYVQLQVGAQMAFLVNAKADSSSSSSIPGLPAGSPYSKMLSYYNRFDYGYGGGIEVYPVKGLLIGARINVSLGDVYKDPGSYSSGGQASFIPAVNVKNNVFQLYLGWKFGK